VNAVGRGVSRVVVAGAIVVAGWSGATTASASTGAAPKDRVVVRGTARVDGRAFDARWIGAVVRRNGLVTPCQAALPPVHDGRFTVAVFRRAASAGCAGPGSAILFWTYRHERLFAQRWVPWSRVDDRVTVRFSTARPGGAAPPITELSGRAFDAAGHPVALGTRIEARVGSTTCGVATVRAGGGFRGYVMNVVGAGSIPTCADGAPISFLIDGRPATQTATNGRSERELFRLSVAPA
jgi:hypothetical protein